MQKVCVIGLGYIGLPLATILANHGFKVLGMDVNADVVEMVNNGRLNVKEPGLQTLVQAAINSRNLKVATKPAKADFFIIAVQTPLTKEKSADLSYIKKAVESIVPLLERGKTVILESTVPPGTTKDIVMPILGRSGFKIGEEVFLAHSPERVLPGAILKELIENDRVIGGINGESALKAKLLYESFVQGEIYLTDATTAEMTKLAENTFRDVNIALANELAIICSDLEINVWDVINLANKHPRVNLHRPGPGVGGHCLAVDPYFIIQKDSMKGKLITVAREVNEGMPSIVVEELKKILQGIERPIVSIFGISYKGDVDDTRGSPGLAVKRLLEDEGIEVRVYDPIVKGPAHGSGDLLEAAVRGADCIAILADHSEFRHLDVKSIGRRMKTRNVLDTKNCLERKAWRKAGFKVYLLGDGRGLS